MLPAVKFADGTDDELVGLAVPYGGPFMYKGRPSDLHGERFDADTDLCLDWYESRPLLYAHGQGEAGTDVVGRVTSWEKKADGVWARMILDRSTEYFETLRQYIEDGKLYLSSAAMAHLVQTDKNGTIKKWPWVELSLTETPANLLAVIDTPTAEKHFKSAGLVKTWEAKALPSGPTPMSGHAGSGYPDHSYEALAHALGLAANAQMMTAHGGQGCMGYVAVTFPEYCVYCHWDGEELEHYRIAYTIGADGLPVLGEWQEVEPAYVPVLNDMEMAVEAAPVAMAAARFANLASALGERTKDLAQRRAAEGRTLSASNARALAAAKAQAIAALTEIDDLTAVVTQPAAKANGHGPEMLRQRLRIARTAYELSGLLAS